MCAICVAHYIHTHTCIRMCISLAHLSQRLLEPAIRCMVVQHLLHGCALATVRLPGWNYCCSSFSACNCVCVCVSVPRACVHRYLLASNFVASATCKSQWEQSIYWYSQKITQYRNTSHKKLKRNTIKKKLEDMNFLPPLSSAYTFCPPLIH